MLNRYFSFYSTFDQGIFNQVFWNSLHGRFFQSSLSSSLSASVVHAGHLPEVNYYRLGQHFTPGLLLWLPIYALFPFPFTLSVLQVVWISGAGLLLFALARRHLPLPLAALITASYYAGHGVIGPTLTNIDDLSQVPLYLFSLLLALEYRAWRLFWLLVGITLLVREDVSIVVLGVGAYMLTDRRLRPAGLVVCGLSISYLLIVTNVLMPLFSPDEADRFMVEKFGQYSHGQPASTLGIIQHMVSQPGLLLGQLFARFPQKLLYLLGLWLPLGLIPALSWPAWLVAGFPLLELFLSQGASVLAINLRYALLVVPGVYYGALLWWSRRPESFGPAWRRFWVFCLGLSLAFTVVSNPNRTLYFLIPDSVQPWVYVSLPRQWQHVFQVRPLLAMIPPAASVSATDDLIPPLSSRQEVLRLPELSLRGPGGQVVTVEYVICDLWHAWQYQAAFLDERQVLQVSARLIDSLYNSRQYGVTAVGDGVVLLQRGVTSDPAAVQAWLAVRRQIQPLVPGLPAVPARLSAS